jgi:hypothetical protein
MKRDNSGADAHRWSWFWGQRAAARLEREYHSLEVELSNVSSQGQKNQSAVDAASKYLSRARGFINNNDVEGGWHCLHAARRCLVDLMDSAQLEVQVLILRQENSKITGWRQTAIADLLKDDKNTTAYRTSEAMRLRDEYDANQYHKIWLTADQLGVLSWVCTMASLFLIPLLVHYHRMGMDQAKNPPIAWGWAMVMAVASFGILGSGFSVAQSLITISSASRMPERVANHWVTMMRVTFGAIAGVAGYAFYLSQLISIRIGDGKDSTGVALTVAFAFGYAGEKLISKIVASFGEKEQEKASSKRN